MARDPNQIDMLAPLAASQPGATGSHAANGCSRGWAIGWEMRGAAGVLSVSGTARCHARYTGGGNQFLFYNVRDGNDPGTLWVVP